MLLIEAAQAIAWYIIAGLIVRLAALKFADTRLGPALAFVA